MELVPSRGDGEQNVGIGVPLRFAHCSFRADRARVRSLVPEGDFIEVYCQCALAVCEQRDVKGLYVKARQGMISDFTGISSPYEAPENPELVLDTARLPLEVGVARVLALLSERGVVREP